MADLHDGINSMERADAVDSMESIWLDYGSIAEVEDADLKSLIQSVHHGQLEDTKTKLSECLFSPSGGYTKPVFPRAKLYSRLIAVALGLTPGDLQREGTDDSTENQGISEYVGFMLYWHRERWVDDKRVVLQYLLKDVLEEDDEVMTVIFCDLEDFDKEYPVPYFTGYDESPTQFKNLIEQVSNLWLKKRELQVFYFDQLVTPITDTVRAATTTTDKAFIQAKVMLCEHLQRRGLKAGARFFHMVTRKRQVHERQGDDMVGQLVKEVFNIEALGGNRRFDDYFLCLDAWDNYWNNVDVRDVDVADRVCDGHGQLVCVGYLPSDAHTDSNLLCWAARRGYHDLVWCVMQSYKPASKSDIEFWTEYAWKYALWCAIRHGDNWLVIRELSAPNWTKDIDFNDYPSGWLPPLHLAALLGDRDRMDSLCKYLQNVKLCAHKKDYLGRTPLDYAMQFKITTNRIKQLFMKKSKPDYKTLGHKDVVKKLLQMDGVGERLKELYDMYIHQANTVLIGAALIASVTFAGWLQPPLGYTDYFQFTRPGAPSNGSVYYESYVAIEGHRSMEVFVVFNSLSFFLAIATMFVGAEATLFIHDNDERTSALIRMRKSIKWMILFFISSMLCIMTAFICAGITILPPIPRLEWSMIFSLVAGGIICFIPLSWILWSLSKDWILSFIETHVVHTVKTTKSVSSSRRSSKSLINQDQVDKIKSELNEPKEGGGKVEEGDGVSQQENGANQQDEGGQEQGNPHEGTELERTSNIGHDMLGHHMDGERNMSRLDSPSFIEGERSSLNHMEEERSMSSRSQGDNQSTSEALTEDIEKSLSAFTEEERSMSSLSAMEGKKSLQALPEGLPSTPMDDAQRDPAASVKSSE